MSGSLHITENVFFKCSKLKCYNKAILGCDIVNFSNIYIQLKFLMCVCVFVVRMCSSCRHQEEEVSVSLRSRKKRSRMERDLLISAGGPIL